MDLGSSVTSVTFSGEGTRMFAVTQDQSLWVHQVLSDASILEDTRTQCQLDGRVTHIAADPHGMHCAVVTSAGEVVIYSVSHQQKLVATRTPGACDATCVAPSGREDGSFYIGTRWGQVLVMRGDHSVSVPPTTTWTALSRDEKLLGMTTSDGRLVTRNAVNGKVVYVHRGASSRVIAGCFYDNDSRFAMATEADEIITLELERAESRQSKRLSGQFAGLAAASTAPLLGVAELEGQLNVWRYTPSGIDVLVSIELTWRPSCVACTHDGTLFAVGGQNAHLYHIIGESVQPFGIGVLEWLTKQSPDVLQNSRLDELWLSEDGQDFCPSREFETTKLGIASIALSSDGSLLAIGFRSNTVLILPVAGLEGGKASVECFQPREELYQRGTRWIVGLQFSPDGDELAVRQSNGMAWVVNRRTQEWRLTGETAGLGNWVFDLKEGFFHSRPSPYTEIHKLDECHDEIRRQVKPRPFAFLSEPVELVGRCAEQNLVVQTRGSRRPALLRLEEQ